MVAALTRILATPARLGDSVRRFHRDRRGVSAVEFAFILPILLTVYFGVVEVGDGLIVNRKVTHVSSTIGDLVAQSKTITNADMTNFMNASEAIVVPYDESLLKIVVSGITIDKDGKATVTWSDTLHGTARTKDSTITLPAGVKQNSTFLVMAEVEYGYTPLFGYLLTGTVNLTETFYTRPRLAATITRTAS